MANKTPLSEQNHKLFEKIENLLKAEEAINRAILLIRKNEGLPPKPINSESASSPTTD